ncbi:S-crystallin SL11 [Holothuria leucospilota]|uniref:S-crystallin SL11 n=1 Tax=Holothuria leucospilota TaxID=206669 RepID=A0A9Q1BE21_HOLLE|nr:S-crystallin SL11 [Holothuria leucospilota]
MPSYKLVYFNFMGLGEPIRMLFQIAGVPFEDVRVPGPYGDEKEEWEKLKPNIGLGTLPVLEVDGKELPQKAAILRYLAREHGFMPKSSWDIAQVDVVIETVSEFLPLMTKLFREEDPEKKKTLIKMFVEEDSQPQLNNLEKLLKKNNGGTGWFFGDTITLADVVVFNTLHDSIPPVIGTAPGDISFLKNHNLLGAFIDRFKAESKVSEWLDKRPKTPF